MRSMHPLSAAAAEVRPDVVAVVLGDRRVIDRARIALRGSAGRAAGLDVLGERGAFGVDPLDAGLTGLAGADDRTDAGERSVGGVELARFAAARPATAAL